MNFDEEDGRPFGKEELAVFTGFEQAFQEMIEKTTRRIEELKQLQREIYGVNVSDFRTAVKKMFEQLEKGEDKLLDLVRLLAEGMMLEHGRAGMRLDLSKVQTMLIVMKHRKNKREGGEKYEG